MIGYLKGKVLSHSDGMVLLENNGIGFEIFCSSSVYNKLVSDGFGEVFVYTAVREDGIYLYGFIDNDEKNMFLKLISVSGVGPKMGITVLSNMNLTDLAIAIAKEDVKSLSKVKGLGKKTAERIILELKEQVSLDGELLTAKGKEEVVSVSEEIVNEDAVVALMSLGFNKQESINAVKSAMKEGAEKVEDVIRISLRNIR